MRFTPKSDMEISMTNLFNPGIYDFEVVDAKDKVSRNGNEMIEIKLKIWNKEGKEKIIFDYLLELMAFKFKHFSYAVNLSKQYETGQIEADDCIGKSGKLELIIDQGKESPNGGYYPDKNSVKDYIISDENMIKNQKMKMDENFINDELPF